MKLAVVGTAGRKDDAPKMSDTLFFRMVDLLGKVVDHLQHRTGETVDTLVSGGAAWADHVAVYTYLMSRRKDWRYQRYNLHLHLPCGFDFIKVRYVPVGDGPTLNHYHDAMLKWDLHSLEDLALCIDQGSSETRWPVYCRTVIGGGFRGRNRRIAEDCDAIVAFTFGTGAIVKPGGTHHTIQHYLGVHQDETPLAYHVDLNTSMCWPKARLAA